MARAVADWRTLNPLFLDFEACGTTGWPIEVGWAEVVDGRVVGEGYLIRPEPEWDPGEWDELAEEVHGLSLARLWAEGVSARVVADRVAAVVRGRTVVTDAAGYDAAFLVRLMEAGVGEAECTVMEFTAVIASLPGRSHPDVVAAGDHSTAAHRAMDDAMRLARVWQAGVARSCGTLER